MTFGLVHGGAHGAWCWSRLAERLERLGHRAIAADLPCTDDEAGAAEYADVVLGVLEGEDEPVIVAHSLGGLTGPLVAARRSVRRLVFVAALLPVPGKSFREQQAEEEIMFPYAGGIPGLRRRFYNRCASADADWAMARLRRQSETPFVERTPLESWPDVPVSYVLCSDDRAVRPDWSRNVVPRRLAVEPVELDGADHSPFLSRPDELAELLVELAS